MLNFIEILYFLLILFVFSSGFALILAATFFGFPQEISKEEYENERK